MGLFDFLGFGGKGSQAFPTIDCVHALQGLDDNSLILIDVRTPGEWANTGVPAKANCKTLQDSDFVEYVRYLREETEAAPIAFFCLSGTRSRKAAKIVQKAGIENIQIVRGGIEAWRKAGLPLKER